MKPRRGSGARLHKTRSAAASRLHVFPPAHFFCTLPAIGLLTPRDCRHRRSADFMSRPAALPFETDIQEMEALLARLESMADQQGGTLEEISPIRRELANLYRKIYNNLTAWDTVLVSRQPERPQTTDYINMLFEEFVELHDDRA